MDVETAGRLPASWSPTGADVARQYLTSDGGRRRRIILASGLAATVLASSAAFGYLRWDYRKYERPPLVYTPESAVAQAFESQYIATASETGVSPELRLDWDVFVCPEFREPFREFLTPYQTTCPHLLIEVDQVREVHRDELVPGTGGTPRSRVESWSGSCMTGRECTAALGRGDSRRGEPRTTPKWCLAGLTRGAHRPTPTG